MYENSNTVSVHQTSFGAYIRIDFYLNPQKDSNPSQRNRCQEAERDEARTRQESEEKKKWEKRGIVLSTQLPLLNFLYSPSASEAVARRLLSRITSNSG